MDDRTFKVLLARARSMGAALVCGAALTACGDGTANVGAGGGTSAVTAKATSAKLKPVSTSDSWDLPVSASKTWNLNATTSINGSSPAPTIRADSITLSWAAPTENTNGSALTNLSGYEIYYGTSASQLTQKISIDTVGVSNYVVENLGSGTWYFEVVAVNTSGVESARSSTVSITI